MTLALIMSIPFLFAVNAQTAHAVIVPLVVSTLNDLIQVIENIKTLIAFRRFRRARKRAALLRTRLAARLVRVLLIARYTFIAWWVQLGKLSCGELGLSFRSFASLANRCRSLASHNSFCTSE